MGMGMSGGNVMMGGGPGMMMNTMPGVNPGGGMGGGPDGSGSMGMGGMGMGPGGPAQLMPPQQQMQQPPVKPQPGGNSTIDAQYMQQQSQIFVFSTNLANKAAESVLQGQFQTIVAYHCSQPGTKKILEVCCISRLYFLRLFS